MVMDVLQSRSQIDRARTELKRRGVSMLDSRVKRAMRKLWRLNGAIGDEIKSWDVLKTVEFIEQRVPRNGAILDIGAYASEILPALHKLDFTHLAGVDLNPQLRAGPHANVIRYEVADFMATPFADSSFAAITAISVIEHGFQGQRLLSEIARLLHPGGFFIASFDYWPQKVDTGDQRFFGLDWLIFSESEVRSLIQEARGYGLAPVGALRFDTSERPVHCAGLHYTFGWLALEKSA